MSKAIHFKCLRCGQHFSRICCDGDYVYCSNYKCQSPRVDVRVYCPRNILEVTLFDEEIKIKKEIKHFAF